MGDLTREEVVEAMADVVLRDLRDRKGVGDELDGIEDADPEIYEEIRQAVGNAALDALLSLLAERGWQVVPVVATEEMYSVEHSPLLVLGAAGNTRVQQWRSGIFRAMCAAAPAPLSEETSNGR